MADVRNKMESVKQKPPDVSNTPGLINGAQENDWNMIVGAEGGEGSKFHASDTNNTTQIVDNGSRRNVEQRNITYNRTDVGPYRLYFELRDTQNGIKRINKFSLGSRIRKMETYRRHIEDMKQVGRNRIMVYVNSYNKANSLMEEINQDKKGEYKAYVPTHLVCVTGIVAGVPSDIPIEEIEEDILCDAPIVSVRRMTRKEGLERVPINRISVMFRSRVLPERVRLFCCSSNVRPFIQKLVVCSNCLRFNHHADNCKSSKRCGQCLAPHETEEEFNSCTKQMRCAHCKSTDHKTQDDACKEKLRQLNIKKLMAKSAITYSEAKELYPIWTQNTYAVLENAEEFPALPNTYVEMSTGKYTNPLREQWQKTNEQRTKIQPAVKVYKDKPKDSNKKPPQGGKRPRTEEANQDQPSTSRQGPGSQTNGVALNNPYKVAEKEKWERITQEAKRNAEEAASRDMKTAIMSFYADFLTEIGTAEDVKRKFKSCTQKHFNLTNSVVENNNKKQF